MHSTKLKIIEHSHSHKIFRYLRIPVEYQMFSNHRFSKRYILWESQSIFNFYEMIYFPSVHPSVLLQYNKLLPFILPSTPWLSLPFNVYRTLLHTNLVMIIGGSA